MKCPPLRPEPGCDVCGRLAGWNGYPWPIIWTKTANEVLDEVAVYRRRIPDLGH